MITFTSRFVLAVALLLAAALAPSDLSAAPADDDPSIAFVRLTPETGRLRILIRDLDGGPTRALRTDISDAQGPAWSPDGRLVAFVGGRGVSVSGGVEGDVDLYVSGTQGRGVRRITRDRQREAAPAWSPSDDTLVFVRYEATGSRSSLWIVGADGSRQRRLTFGNVDVQPSWSPDGKRIVFVRISATFESGIWEVRPNGKGLRRLVQGINAATQPVWSPDGSRLLLTDGQTLFTVRPDGSDRREVTRLTADPGGARVDPQPTWSRTGWIVFRQLRVGLRERSDIWRVQSDGSRLQRLTLSPGHDSEPSVRP